MSSEPAPTPVAETSDKKAGAAAAPSTSGPLVKLRLLRAGAQAPRYMSEHAAGMDLHASLAEDEDVVIAPGERTLIGTGVAVELPVDHEAQVRPRSGLALKHGVSIVNTPGTIDADYRGEIMVLLVNFGDAPFVVRTGDRIAQLVVAPVARARLEVVEDLSETRRGSGGYGSTGA